MLEKNSLPLGLLLGFLLPAIGYLAFLGIYELLETLGWVSDTGFRPLFRERTSAIIALALNAFLLNYYQKRYMHNTVRGIVAITSLFIILWLVLFGKYVL